MKLLVIRMSSMGDVILSTSFLQSLPADVEVDWLVAKEFAFILRGHPRIGNLIEFDKKTGLKGWIRLIHQLSHREYDARVDLHVTLRSQVARIFFHWFDLSNAIWIPWNRISKQRFRFYGYLLFKRLWPYFLRPVPLWKRCALLAKKVARTGDAPAPPSLMHSSTREMEARSRYALTDRRYFAAMPASRWVSKEWGALNYAEFCEREWKKSGCIPVVMGRLSDESAVNLVQHLKDRGVEHRSVLNEDDFSITSSLLHGADFYVGSDTGLAHLAEAVGTPVTMIFGPTRPDLGFGPWKEESSSVTADVWCSPCSKDGRICYRFTEPYACLKKISPDQIIRRGQS